MNVGQAITAALQKRRWHDLNRLGVECLRRRQEAKRVKHEFIETGDCRSDGTWIWMLTRCICGNYFRYEMNPDAS